MDLKAALAALLMASVALAGCSGADDGPGGAAFSVTEASDPVTEPFVFEAKVAADEYKWEMGDGRAPQFGQMVEYVYGFTDGEVRVKLTTTSGGEVQQHPAVTLSLGTGTNAKPSFLLQASHDWVQVGETFTLSGAGSTDGDGDPLLFTWFCKRDSDIGPVGAGHVHGVGGVAYGASGPDPIPVAVLDGVDVPAADREVSGDFCANLAGDATFTEDATVSGAFETPGIYTVTMLAKDPKSPSLPGSLTIYVTEEPRVSNPVVLTLDGSLGIGKPKSDDPDVNLDSVFCQENVDQCDHTADERFEVLYPLLNFTAEVSGAGQALFKGCSTEKAGETTDAITGGDAYLDAGTHCIRVYNRDTGSSADYTVTVTIAYETDPSKLFEAPGAH